MLIFGDPKEDWQLVAIYLLPVLDASICALQSLANSRSFAAHRSTLPVMGTKEKGPPHGDPFSLVSSTGATWNTLYPSLIEIADKLEEFEDV